MQSQTDIESLEVRNYKSLKWFALFALILFIVIVISLVILFTSKDFWNNFQPYYLYLLTAGFPISIIAVIGYTRLLYYNKKIQLKIDKYGIWTPTNKTWLWKDIWYFYTTNEPDGSDRINFLIIKLKDGVNDEKNSLTLPLDNYDKSKKEIRTLLEKYAALNGVEDLGDDVK